MVSNSRGLRGNYGIVENGDNESFNPMNPSSNSNSNTNSGTRTGKYSSGFGFKSTDVLASGTDTFVGGRYSNI